MTRRHDSRRLADRKRSEQLPWRKWYATARWKAMARAQRAKAPWCEPCRREGRSRPFHAADHVIPHHGDPVLFWTGKLQSCCEHCHNANKQREEHEGFSRAIGEDGWPADPRHPFNAGRA